MIRSGNESKDSETKKTMDDQKKKKKSVQRMHWNGLDKIRKRKHVMGSDIPSREDN